MKKALIIVLFFCTGLIFAQETTYKKEGGLVAVTHYYENGNVKETGFYKNKKLHGEWTKYNKKGIKVVRAYYNDGKKTGKWMYSLDGVLTEVDYESNKIVNVYTWNKDDRIAVN